MLIKKPVQVQEKEKEKDEDGDERDTPQASTGITPITQSLSSPLPN